MAIDGHGRVYLRGLGHALRPHVHVGKNGVTEAIQAQLLQELEAHELVKVRFLEGAPHDRKERAAAGSQLAGATGSEVVGQIGRTLLLFRENPDPARRRVRLPARAGRGGTSGRAPGEPFIADAAPDRDDARDAGDGE